MQLAVLVDARGQVAGQAGDFKAIQQRAVEAELTLQAGHIHFNHGGDVQWLAIVNFPEDVERQAIVFVALGLRAAQPQLALTDIRLRDGLAV